MELKIDRLNNYGTGVGIWQGKKVFVPYALPNEHISAKIISENKKYITGHLEKIIIASDERIKPVCRHYYKCGGCNLQHLSDKLYLEFKRQLFTDAIVASGFHLPELPDPVIIGSLSRRRITLKAYRKNNQIILGYYQANSHNIINIDECHIIEPELFKLIPKIRTLLASLSQDTLNQAIEIALTLCDNGIDCLLITNTQPQMTDQELLADFARQNKIVRISWQTGKSLIPIIVITPPQIRFGSHKVDIPAGCFLQTSKLCQQIVTDLIIKYSSSAQRVIDLYSGCGTYSLPMSEYSQVHAVEGSSHMLNAITQASRNSRYKLSTELKDIYHNPILPDILGNYDLAVINPPRNGAEPQTRNIAASTLKSVIMVSCYPQSFSRDIAILREAGFQLVETIAIDQFHWSPHLELVAVLRK